MTEVRRRTFLKTAALAAAGSLLPGCEREAHRLIPRLLPDDEIVPGVANWYASTCGECRAGCGIIVRVMEGRAKKIEGNPDHPVNHGKLCARGQASLQQLYNPDRLRQPLQRNGPRGSNLFTPLSWEEGLVRCADGLRGASGKPMMISRPLSGTLERLVSDFMSSIGGRLYYYSPDADLPLQAAWHDMAGTDSRPYYDLAHSDYLLSFGAPFLEQWLSPVAMSIKFGQMRQGQPARRGRFIHIEPRMSLTAANADRWIPLAPGTEGLLALAIGHVMLREGRFHFSERERARYRSFYGSIELEDVACATDVPLEAIVGLAREFLSASAPLAIGGGPACSHTNGTVSLIAINGLNAMVGTLAPEYRPGCLLQGTSYDRGDAVSWLTEQAVMDMVRRGDEPGAVLLYDSNPLFAMPPSVPIRALFDRAAFVVSFNAFVDESTGLADLVLPDRSPLESWNDQVLDTATPAIGLAQPVVDPLYDTRQFGDTLLDLRRRLGRSDSPSSAFHDLLQEQWRRFLDGRPHPDAPDWFETAWTVSLQQGGWWQDSSPPLRPLAFHPTHRFEPPVLSGDEQEFPFSLHLYPSMTIGYGDGANRPWLQQLPDTLTSVVWGSWLELNPITAKSLNLRQGDVARITSSVASIDAPVVVFPGIRPDVVAMPLGQGHTSYGRYAEGRGINPVALLAPAVDSVTGSLAYGATRVRIEPAGVTGRLVTLERPAMNPNDLLTISKSERSHGT